MNSGSVSFN